MAACLNRENDKDKEISAFCTKNSIDGKILVFILHIFRRYVKI